MSNPTTAAEWRQVAANSLNQITKNDATIASLNTQRRVLDAQIAALVAKRDTPSTTEFINRSLIQSQINSLITQQINLDNSISNLVGQQAQLNADYNNANAQAAQAEIGIPGANTNTPPETIVPGQVNTAVIVDAEPLIENVDPEVPEDIVDPEIDVFEPLQEPPIPEADEFTGIDEQIQFQQQLEDGSLEFAGIDQQIAANENTLQEPPALTDEEVDDYFNQLREEQIENEAPADIEENVFDPGTTFNAGEENVFNPNLQDTGSSRAIGIAKAGAQSTATIQDSASFQKAKDWRVRISLAPNAKYLYKGMSKTEAGILAPLQDTDGVIFPYTPNVSVSYVAGYDATDIAHSNYKVFQYKGSSVDNITITGDFTAQDTTEANYMLAVIHFFRSVTKMFYGQDQNPKNGVPPPLCYLSGFGTYQFDNHPMAITNFTYATPTDVDYIRAGSQTNMPGQSVSQQSSVLNTIASAASAIRLLSSNLTVKAPNFQAQNSAINSEATYVPTKISISITAVPVVSRNDISNSFSLKQYASGKLLQGSKRNGGGIW